MMTAKENYLALLRHEPVDYIPNVFLDVCVCGGAAETFENGPEGGGEDGFGCRWHPSDTASGQGSPEAGYIVLDDVTVWEDVVKFPDLDAFDWEELAKEQLAGVDRGKTPVEYTSWNSQFLRLTHLMGFGDGLCALIEEPEACYDLMSAITDYKIKIIERAYEYFKPDSFINFDDVATESSLFLSKSAYQELIKPHHKRMNDAAKAYGMYPGQHCCGYCQDIIDDFIDEGSVVWQCAQPSNDIEMIIQKYGDKISVAGGYDTQGTPGQPTATDEEIKAEVKRCMETYGKYGKSYGFMGFLLATTGDEEAARKGGLLLEEANIQGRAIMNKA